MKVKIYVNWNDQMLYTEEEYKARIKDDAKDIEEENDAFDDFLNEHHYCIETFDFDEKEKTKVREEFHEWCKKTAEAYLARAFEKIEKEV